MKPEAAAKTNSPGDDDSTRDPMLPPIVSRRARPHEVGRVHELVAESGEYLVFEDGPSVDVHLQWASDYDAADQAGQSRLWGGIHLWPDDAVGRENGARADIAAAARAQEYLLGTFRE